jgi:hypothetical protein
VLTRAVEYGAEVGSYWAIFPFGTSLVPGNSIAIAKVEETNGDDASATLHPSDVDIPAGSVATPVVGSGNNQIAIRFDGLPVKERLEVERNVVDVQPNVTIAGQGEFTRIIFEVRGTRCEALTLGGLHTLGAFQFSDVKELASRASQVIAMALASTKLGNLRNPVSTIELAVRTTLPKSSNARSFKAVASGDLRAYRIRKPNEPRTAANSLVLEIEANRDCYLTIVNVDATGGLNLLFPNEHQKPGYYDLGLIPGGETVRIPDSLDGNDAGFNWDCSPPAGVESIRVFAATDLSSAETIRRYLGAMGSGESGWRGSMNEGLDQVDALGEALARHWLSRGFQATPSSPTKQILTEDTQPDWTSVSLTVLVEE